METKKTTGTTTFSTQTTYFTEGYDAIHVQSRDGNKITFMFKPHRCRERMAKGQVTADEYKGQPCESLRLMGPKGWITFYAANSVKGRPLEELPKEEQEKIRAAINRDIEFRKEHPEHDNHKTVTIIGSDGNITGTYKTKN